MIDTLPTLYLSPFAVTLFISLLVPIVTGLLTKYALPATAKAIIMIVLDAAVALVVGAQMLPDGTAVINSQTLLSALIAVVVSVATYLGIYVPVKLSNRPDGVLGANVGIGPSNPE
jgi:hypothetical protein